MSGIVKVIFHINEPGRWPVLIANVRNLLKEVGGSGSHIRVLANGSAVRDFLPDQEYSAAILSLADEGVVMVACANSLRGQNIAPELLPEKIAIVPAGVLDLIEKQAAGFAYIKP